MNKIGKLLKEHENLSEELLNDEGFVEECEKIFEESGLDFSKEMLKSILDDVEDSLKEVQDLSDDKLADVIGGVGVEGENVTKKERTKSQIVGSIAIKVVSTLVGTVVGGAVGYYVFGAKDTTYLDKDHKVTGYSSEKNRLSAFIGAGTGNVLGYRLGALISDKLGLE